jgi:hypothetical protein
MAGHIARCLLIPQFEGASINFVLSLPSVEALIQIFSGSACFRGLSIQPAHCNKLKGLWFDFANCFNIRLICWKKSYK